MMQITHSNSRSTYKKQILYFIHFIFSFSLLFDLSNFHIIRSSLLSTSITLHDKEGQDTRHTRQNASVQETGCKGGSGSNDKLHDELRA